MRNVKPIKAERIAKHLLFPSSSIWEFTINLVILP